MGVLARQAWLLACGSLIGGLAGRKPHAYCAERNGSGGTVMRGCGEAIVRAVFGIGWLAVCAVALPFAAGADGGGGAADFSEPVFTRRHAPLCDSREDLASLVAMLRAHQADLAAHASGCTAASDDGLRVVVLDRNAPPDGWVRVRFIKDGDLQRAFWTVGWMLRNAAGSGSPLPQPLQAVPPVLPDRPEAGHAGSAQPAQPVPAGAAEPAAGRVKVCLTRAAEDPAIPVMFVVPGLSVFQDGGKRAGDLRNPWTRESYRADTVNPAAALVTTGDLRLSRDNPCAEVGARMWAAGTGSVAAWPASEDHVWDFSHVLGYPTERLQQPNNLESLRGMLALRAAVVADVGNPLVVSDDDAARLDPSNPLGRISGDAVLARSVPPDGPDGKGNFRICAPNDFGGAGYGTLTVPAGLLFESSAGTTAEDWRATQAAAGATGSAGVPFAVATKKAVTLTKENPCALTSANSVLSGDWRWPFPLVRLGDGLQFHALEMAGGKADLPGHLGDAIQRGMLKGTPVADIGSPVTLGSR